MYLKSVSKGAYLLLRIIAFCKPTNFKYFNRVFKKYCLLDDEN